MNVHILWHLTTSGVSKVGHGRAFALPTAADSIFFSFPNYNIAFDI